MTATEYPQKLSVENSLGLHYSTFRPFWPTCLFANQSLTTCRIRKLRSNRRSWASDARPRPARRPTGATTAGPSRPAGDARSYPLAWGPAIADLLLHRALSSQRSCRRRRVARRHRAPRPGAARGMYKMRPDRRGRPAELERTAEPESLTGVQWR